MPSFPTYGHTFQRALGRPAWEEMITNRQNKFYAKFTDFPAKSLRKSIRKMPLDHIPIIKETKNTNYKISFIFSFLNFSNVQKIVIMDENR